MKNVKSFFKTGCLLPGGIIVIGLIAYFIWSSLLAPRFSALGACDKDDGCLYTAFNGNRTVSVIGYSPDGSRFLTDGSNDGIIHDAANGRKITDLDEGSDNYNYVVSGDRTEIAAYRQDSIKFFDWDGELLRTWTPDADDSVRDMAMVASLDGFVTVGNGGASVWNGTDGTLITHLADGSFLHVTASADGKYVAAYDFVDDEIFVFSLEKVAKPILIGEVEALSIHLSADGSLLAAGGPDGAFVWNTADGALVAALEPEGLKVTAASLSDDGTRLAVGFENGIITVLDIPNDELVATFELKSQPNQLMFTPDDAGLAVGMAFDVDVSGGELIFRPRLSDRLSGKFRPGETLRTDQNRIDVKPGYAIVLSFAD